VNPTSVTLAEHIAATLSPALGPHTADVVARHLCTKFGVGDDVDAIPPAQLAELREFLRRGLVAYVGPERAAELATVAVAPRV
jgi:hypothetical protein